MISLLALMLLRLQSFAVPMEPTYIPTPLGEMATVTLARNGKKASLGASAQHKIRKQIETLLSTCPFNSDRHPQYFEKHKLRQTWQRILKKSFLSVSYKAPTLVDGGMKKYQWSRFSSRSKKAIFQASQ